MPKHTPLFAVTGRDRTLSFRTGYPVTLWPLRVESAAIVAPDRFPFLDFASDVASVLRISLECLDGTFGDLELRNLRFHLNTDTRVGSVLYETLFHDVLRVALVGEGHPNPRMLPASVVSPVGFNPGEELLPGGPHSHSGYGLLHEYFAFPAKFAFFDVDGLENAASGKKLDILFLLNKPPAGRLTIDSETFALGCTPIVNLFPKVAEPVRLDHKSTEYRVVPDQRREAATEVHSILRVASQRDDEDDSVAFQPFFSFDHAGGTTRPRAFWSSRVQPVPRADIPGSETLLSFVDLDFNPVDPGVQSVYVRALLHEPPSRRAVADGRGAAVRVGGADFGVSSRSSARRLSATRRSAAGTTGSSSRIWRSIISRSKAPRESRALREMLKLYAGDDATALRQIAGIRDLESRRVTRRVGTDAWRGFCRGVLISLTLDEADFVGGNPYLFGAVLGRFFAQHTAVEFIHTASPVQCAARRNLERMAAVDGNADRSVAARLSAEPFDFEFFQAVSLLERMRPDATSVGEGVNVDREAVRFEAEPSLDFPASDIVSLKQAPAKNAPSLMRVAFFTLAGVQGPLPRAYIERMLGARSKSTALKAFLNIFHHRLVSIFYRARRKRRLALDGRPAGAEHCGADASRHCRSATTTRSRAGFTCRKARHCAMRRCSRSARGRRSAWNACSRPISASRFACASSSGGGAHWNRKTARVSDAVQMFWATARSSVTACGISQGGSGSSSGR